MKPIDIAPSNWPGFCEDFSRRHRGQTATTFVLGSGAAAATRCTARDLPFAAVTLDANQRDITLRLGDGKLHITECVQGVASLFMLQGDDGGEAGLRIDRTDDSAIMLTLSATAPRDGRGGGATVPTSSQPTA
jgi:hypothetical protein